MKKITILGILFLMMIANVFSEITEDDIIMYYDFKTSSISNGNLTDKVNNWDGIIQEQIVTGETGLIDEAFYFNGSQTQQAFINISGNPLLNSTNGSFYIWLKIDNVPSSPTRDGDRYWMYIMVNQKGYDYSIAGHDGDFSCTLYWEFYLMFLEEPQFTSFQTYTSSTQCGTKNFAYHRTKDNSNPNGFLNDGNWHLWVVTWNGGTVKQYWDGSLMTVQSSSNTITFSNLLNDSNTHIGNFYTNVYNSFNGWIDELALFNRDLTSTEISNAYNSGNGRTRNNLLGLLQENEYYNSIIINAENNNVTTNLFKNGYTSSINSNTINWLNIIWEAI